jgi:hypothetical protein
MHAGFFVVLQVCPVICICSEQHHGVLRLWLYLGRQLAGATSPPLFCLSRFTFSLLSPLPFQVKLVFSHQFLQERKEGSEGGKEGREGGREGNKEKERKLAGILRGMVLKL